MPVPDWRKLVLNDGVVPEPTPDNSRLVLWLRGVREGGVQHWERVGSVARAEHPVEAGVGGAAAIAIRAQQQIRGFFAKLLARFSKTEAEGTWLLPSGESVQQVGAKQTDLILVWAVDESIALDEQRIKARWPQSTRIEKLGQNLFLVGGVATQNPSAAPVPAQPQGSPREQAASVLAAARVSGDRLRIASALTDLGILYLREGAAPQAVTHLEEALDLVRRLGDRLRETDVIGNLGLAVMAVGQSQRALELCEQGLVYARADGDLFAEKTALDQLGLVHAGLRDPGRAIGYFEQALTLARKLGDWQHEVDLLWLLAIQHAELGQRGQASDRGQAAIDLLQARGKPQAAMFADQLNKYRAGDMSEKLGGTSDHGAAAQPVTPFGSSVVTNAWSSHGGLPFGPEAADQSGGPGLLRMALSAVKSFGKFVGSGLKVVTPEMHQQRQQTCLSCEHHTGLRCRLCGCFTDVKAWLPHEDCPAGKWPT